MSLISKGTFGKVYSKKTKDGREVALKIAKNEDYNFYNTREYMFLVLMNHSNIVRPSLPGILNGKLYFCMEKANHSLYKNRVPSQDVFTICGDMAEGLAYMHSLHIIHADIKPENILIFRDPESWRAKYCDFGGAFHCRGYVETRNPICSETTRAPELFSEQKKFGPEIDVWSLGATMYYALTGENLVTDITNLPSLVTDPELPESNSDEEDIIIDAIFSFCIQKKSTRKKANDVSRKLGRPTFVSETQRNSDICSEKNTDFSLLKAFSIGCPNIRKFKNFSTKVSLEFMQTVLDHE